MLWMLWETVSKAVEKSRKMTTSETLPVHSIIEGQQVLQFQYAFFRTASYEMSIIFNTRRHNCFHFSGNKLAPQRLRVTEGWENRVVIAETWHLTLDVIVVTLAWCLGKLLLFLFNICKR